MRNRSPRPSRNISGDSSQRRALSIRSVPPDGSTARSSNGAPGRHGLGLRLGTAAPSGSAPQRGRRDGARARRPPGVRGDGRRCGGGVKPQQRGISSDDETHPMRLQRRGFSLLRVALPCFSTRESAKRGGRAFRSCRIFRSRSGDSASLVEHRPQERHAAMREAVADSRRAWLRREIDPAAAA
jgi:hypothetical protein